ncbi:DUF5131 family protein [Leptospira adleri]|uniref:Phage Gp37/Gp68 family protein n=1 Tax=Leptospira adleri TaxID=2023186 RepID=A0A2M9YJC0_9LEPT|nr:phage Gp37/Gp68 family protein [Leptospira adleri]PJZ51596.1 hypothetical protein CH380_19310 [Leptospira adleri]PJZ61895.1 hypothetical protein CH376_10855 [Leptospira adleri]
MKDSKIEWTDHTWNPVTGCTKVSAGCKNCYAETLSKRKFGEWAIRDFSKVEFKYKKLKDPFSIRKPSKIFVNSMSDLFHKDVPDSFIDRVFGVIALNPQHTFQILTKRSERMLDYMKREFRASEIGEAAHTFVEMNFQNKNVKMPPEWMKDNWNGSVEWPLPNVWLGVSAENQKTANDRIPKLLETPAFIRFISKEPLLEYVNLEEVELEDGTLINSLTGDIYIGYEGEYSRTGNKLDWVVVGGESGPHARPVHPDWICNLRDQCIDADVPFFFKQWGEWIGGASTPLEQSKSEEGRKAMYQRGKFHDWNDGNVSLRCGKKESGAMLDGVEWKQFPKGRV